MYIAFQISGEIYGFTISLEKILWYRNIWYLLSYYLANKRGINVRFQGLEIPTLIGEK